jgi:hypothetical protein
MLIFFYLTLFVTSPISISHTQATLARVATGAAITFAYPLMFAGVKASLKNLLARPVATVTATAPTSPTTTTQTQIPASASTTATAVQATATDPKLLKAATIAVLAAITAVAVKCGEEDGAYDYAYC